MQSPIDQDLSAASRHPLAAQARDGAPEGRRKLLHGLTDLFLDGVDDAAERSKPMLGDIVCHVLDEVGEEARIELAQRVAEIDRFPPDVIRKLASDIIEVALPVRALTRDDGAALREAFEAEYGRLYARHIPDAAIEIMSWRVSVAERAKGRERIAATALGEAVAAVGSREVFDAGHGALVPASVLQREQLKAGNRIGGPALIVEDGTSTFVSSRFEAHVDNGGALVLTAKE
jgi:N-methylhydantoinase A/oxoprolinase/acetone carboxylase beta subunit